jgi:hypothetical protein
MTINYTTSGQPGARFWRWVFLAAGVVGLAEILPLYFSEAKIGLTDPPPVTHPEFYYGFLGVVIAWQIVFIIISRDPARYRPLFPAIFLEKLLYPVAAFWLYGIGRLHGGGMLIGGVIDLIWLALFTTAWIRTGARS